MIQKVSIILVIWGLIVQTLMANTFPSAYSSESEIMVDSAPAALEIQIIERGYNNDAQSLNNPVDMPCHASDADEAPSANNSCDHCDLECLDLGLCTTTCVLGVAAVNHSTGTLPNRSIQSIKLLFINNTGVGFLTPIFHPPKIS